MKKRAVILILFLVISIFFINSVYARYFTPNCEIVPKEECKNYFTQVTESSGNTINKNCLARNIAPACNKVKLGNAKCEGVNEAGLNQQQKKQFCESFYYEEEGVKYNCAWKNNNCKNVSICENACIPYSTCDNCDLNERAPLPENFKTDGCSVDNCFDYYLPTGENFGTECLPSVVYSYGAGARASASGYVASCEATGRYFCLNKEPEIGDKNCKDKIDNDCDGKIDENDEDCVKPEIYVTATPDKAFTSDRIEIKTEAKSLYDENIIFKYKIKLENEKGPFRQGYDQARKIERPKTIKEDKEFSTKRFDSNDKQYHFGSFYIIQPSVTRIGDEITINIKACVKKKINNKEYETCSDDFVVKVEVPHCPPDTPCTGTWPSQTGVYDYTKNYENIKSCNLFTVCDKSLASLIDEVEDECSGNNDYRGCLLDKIFHALGSEKKWMKGYWAQEFSCFGSPVFCKESDSNSCQCSRAPYNQLNNIPKAIGGLECKNPGAISGHAPLGWKDDFDMSKNSCWLSDVPAYVSLLKLKTGTCSDYSIAETTLLRKAGYKKDEAFSAFKPGHSFTIIFDSAEYFTIYDDNNNAQLKTKISISSPVYMPWVPGDPHKAKDERRIEELFNDASYSRLTGVNSCDNDKDTIKGKYQWSDFTICCKKGENYYFDPRGFPVCGVPNCNLFSLGSLVYFNKKLGLFMCCPRGQEPEWSPVFPDPETKCEANCGGAAREGRIKHSGTDNWDGWWVCCDSNNQERSYILHNEPTKLSLSGKEPVCLSKCEEAKKCKGTGNYAEYWVCNDNNKVCKQKNTGEPYLE